MDDDARSSGTDAAPGSFAGASAAAGAGGPVPAQSTDEAAQAGPAPKAATPGAAFVEGSPPEGPRGEATAASGPAGEPAEARDAATRPALEADAAGLSGAGFGEATGAAATQGGASPAGGPEDPGGASEGSAGEELHAGDNANPAGRTGNDPVAGEEEVGPDGGGEGGPVAEQAPRRVQRGEASAEGPAQGVPSHGVDAATAGAVSGTSVPGSGGREDPVGAAARGDASAAAGPPPSPVGSSESKGPGSVLDQVRFVLRPGLSEARVQLQPPGLGSVSVRVSLAEGELRARIDVERPEVLRELELQRGELERSLAARGTPVARVELGLRSAEPPAPAPQAFFSGDAGASGAASGNAGEPGAREGDRDRGARRAAPQPSGQDAGVPSTSSASGWLA